LSYARLFGMALATSVIAMVFNTIAGMMTGSVPGWIFAVVIFLIGHVFNIGINSLGAFVHSARLQYIEFFSKFYEGGGTPFDPLRIKLKNYRMVK
jgi:V/A-type H+-transporting ATPase subunit I